MTKDIKEEEYDYEKYSTEYAKNEKWKKYKFEDDYNLDEDQVAQI